MTHPVFRLYTQNEVVRSRMQARIDLLISQKSSSFKVFNDFLMSVCIWKGTCSAGYISSTPVCSSCLINCAWKFLQPSVCHRCLLSHRNWSAHFFVWPLFAIVNGTISYKMSFSCKKTWFKRTPAQTMTWEAGAFRLLYFIQTTAAQWRPNGGH